MYVDDDDAFVNTTSPNKEDTEDEPPVIDDALAKFGTDNIISEINFARYPNLKALAISATSMNNFPLPATNAAHPLQDIVHLRLESTQRNWPTLNDSVDKYGKDTSVLHFRWLNVERLTSHLRRMPNLCCLEFDWLIETQEMFDNLGPFLKSVLSAGEIGVSLSGLRSLREITVRLLSRDGNVEDCKALEPLHVLVRSSCFRCNVPRMYINQWY